MASNKKRARSKAAPRDVVPGGRKHRPKPRVALSEGSKLARLIALLKAPEGATLDALMAETGWQAHSVRGAISGVLKKKRALKVSSTVVEGVRLYRIGRT
jgi:hypothetical protein